MPEYEDDEVLCFVCREEEGDGIFCSCITCSNYYHLDCYVPTLEKEPSVDWECLMCKEREYFASLPMEQTSSSGNMTKRELHLSRRLVLEMYGVEDIKTGRRASKPFRKVGDLEFESYKKIIKDPVALDLIKDRLDKENPDQYKTMSEFMSDMRRMFINCRTYWALNHMSHANAHHSGTIYAKYGSLLEKALDAKRKELTIGVEEKIPESANKKFVDQPEKPRYYANRMEQADLRRPRMKIGAGKPNEKKEEDPTYEEEKPERSYKPERIAVNPSSNLNRGIEKAKREMESRYNSSGKRDASAEDDNEDEDEDELLLRKKKCQEMFEMYGEQGTKKGSANPLAGLWDQSKEFKKLGGSTDEESNDGNNNSKNRSKELNDRIERVAQHFANAKDRMGGTPKRGAMIIPNDEGAEGYTRQRIRAKYVEEGSD